MTLSPSPSISACRRLYAVGLVIRKYRVSEIALEVVSNPAPMARSPEISVQILAVRLVRVIIHILSLMTSAMDGLEVPTLSSSIYLSNH